MHLVTACPLDCPDACSLHAEVVDGRLVSVDAAPGNDITGGFICKKVKHHARRVYAPERVLTPLVRTGPKGAGAFRAASWDEAIDVVATRIGEAARTHGPNAVTALLYGSSASATAQMLYQRLWRRFGATYVAPTVCAATHSSAYAATFGDMDSADPRDVVHAQLVVVWGSNPAVSNTHFLPLVTEARRRGARVVVVDPRRTGMARRADLHVALRPGTDTAFALAVARVLAHTGRLATGFLAEHAEGVDEFLAAADEWTPARAAAECGVPEADILTFADLLASTRPAFFRVGWGLERHRSGGSACAAVFALPVLAGQFGVLGAGVLSSTGGDSVRIPWHEADRGGPARRVLNLNELGAHLCDPALDPPISVLYVAGSNVAATNPDQVRVLAGLARDDLFTVVHDQVLTDTARFADVVLPATTHFETADLVTAYGSYVLQRTRPVIDRVGESRSDNEVAALLAAALGYPAGEFDPDPERLFAASLGGHPVPEPALELRAEGTVVQFRDTAPRGGRARLAALEGIGVPVQQSLESSLPLALLTPSSAKTINTMFAEFDPPDPSVRLHPDDAAARALGDGDRVRVRDAQVSITTTLRLDPDLRPGVALMPKGMWCRSYPEGLTANAFAPGTLSDLAGGACFNDARVEVERA